MIKNIAFVTLILLSTISFSQAVVYSVDNKKVIKIYEEAKKSLDAREHEKCLELLNKAIKEDPKFIESYILMAYVNLEKNN